jgi:hypothetical protein
MRSYLSTTEWATRTITNADGTLAEERYPAVQVLYEPATKQTSMWFDGGMGIINDSHGYTETHLIHVVVYDAAGNEVESEPVRVYVIHKEEPEEESSVPHTASLLPVRREYGYEMVQSRVQWAYPVGVLPDERKWRQSR